MMSHIEMEYAKTLKQVSQLERELDEAQAEIARLKVRCLAAAVAKECDAPNSTYQTVLAMAAKIRKGE